MASFGYYTGIEQIYKALIDLESDTIKAMLLDTAYSPDQSADQFVDDISANELSGGGYARITLTGKSILTSGDVGTFDADDISWSGIFKNARYLVIFKDTGSEATSPLIALVDLGGSRNAPLSFVWNEDGIFGFRSSDGLFATTDFENAEDPIPDWNYSSTNAWDEQVNPNIVPLTDDAFDAVNGAWEHYVDCENAVSPYDFDSVTDVNSQLSIQGLVYKEGSNALKAAIDGTGTNAYGTTTLTGASTQTVCAFWFNTGSLLLAAGETADPHRQDNVILVRIARASATEYQMTLYSRLDGGTYPSDIIYTYDPTDEPEWLHIIILWKASTGAGNDDGYTYAIVNGVLVGELTGIDSDTLTITNLNYGMVGHGGSPSGDMYFDEIYNDPDGATFSVAINQQQGRPYSMCAACISEDITGQFAMAAPDTEVWVEFDFKTVLNIVSARGAAWLRDIATATKTCWYLQYLEGSGIRIVYDDDTSANNTGNYYAFTEGTVAVYWRASSAPAADDGEIALYIDGVLKERLTGLDTDTMAADNVYYGTFFATGYFVNFYGTMRYSIDDNVITVKDWAAQSGNYGMGWYFSPSQASSELNRNFTNSSIFTFEYEIDFTDLTITSGDAFNFIYLSDTGAPQVVMYSVVSNAAGTKRVLFYYWEGASFTFIGQYDWTAPFKIRIIWADSLSGDSTGWIFVYIDGAMQIYDTDLSSENVQADRIRIFPNGVDATTYGQISMDKLRLSYEYAAMVNPFNTDYSNPSSVVGDFEDDVVPDLESNYFFVLVFGLTFTPLEIPGECD